MKLYAVMCVYYRTFLHNNRSSPVNYFDRLHYLDLESLELRRLKYDRVMCFKICRDDTDIEINSLFMFQCNTVLALTRAGCFEILYMSHI